MYKKRFAKWGFYKNSKRSALSKPERTRPSVAGIKQGASRELACISKSPELAEDEVSVFMILTNVRTWSTAFFESVQPNESVASVSQQAPTESQLRQFKAKEINFALKLVVDLLDRGNGVLAGRMARKAFLLAEDMLTLEGPALMWNLLEMMHHMVTDHAQLFRILLGHMIGLARDVMPGAHPLIAMLRGLQRLVASLMSDSSKPSCPPSSSSSSTGGESPSTSVDLKLQYSILPILLRRAWTVNAEMLLHKFDPRLFPLYFRILYPTWDTCSIPAPSRLVGAAKQWLSLLEAKHLLQNSTDGQSVGYHAMKLLAYTLPKEDKMLESLLTPLTEGLMDDSPQVYEVIRKNSLEAVQEGRHSIPQKEHKLDLDSTISLCMLAVLATAKILDSSRPVNEQLGAAESITTYVPPIDAAPVASAVKTLIGITERVGPVGAESGPPPDNVERIRAVVTLRGYAEGQIHPQVVREMWLLQDALVAAGRHEEAQEVERDAYHRMKEYVEDIPVDSA